jgi:hypothetical protein
LRMYIMSSDNKEELGQEPGQEPKLEEPKLEEPKLPPPFKIQKRYEKYNQHFLNIQNAMKEIEHELDELHKEIDGISPEPMDLHETVAPNQVETSIPEPGASESDTGDLKVVPGASESDTSALKVVPGASESDTSALEVVPGALEVVPSDLESDTESDSDTESPYTKKYSSKLQYPTTELALKVEDYIESNPEIRDFTLVYCCYSINTDSMIPFVVYSGKVSDGKYQFPSIPVTDNNIESYKNTIKDGAFTGYIPDATNPSVIYMFYSVLTPNLLPGKRATINELCHLKSVDGNKIDETVDKLFTQNGDLLYITDLETSEHIPVPFSGYLCTMDDANHITNVVIEEDEEEDIQLFTTDIFNVGLQDEFYYLTTKSLNPDALRYVIFPLKAVNFDKSITDYSEYNSVYYKSPEMEFWAITSIKQIGKI